jgi:hypothetical protein
MKFEVVAAQSAADDFDALVHQPATLLESDTIVSEVPAQWTKTRAETDAVARRKNRLSGMVIEVQPGSSAALAGARNCRCSPRESISETHEPEISCLATRAADPRNVAATRFEFLAKDDPLICRTIAQEQRFRLRRSTR